MNVFLDESGDLGFDFRRPFRQGGSSRYLTIVCLLISQRLSHHPKRIVRKMYARRHRKTTNELKGRDLKPAEKDYFAKRTIRLLNKHPSIKILAITVKKENVQAHIRQDPNKLYNYMINLILPDKIKQYQVIKFIPDRRVIKVKSGNSLVDYLQIRLWFDLHATTVIQNHPQESHKVLNLQFVDWIAHIIWSKYEDNDTSAFNILIAKIRSVELFF